MSAFYVHTYRLVFSLLSNAIGLLACSWPIKMKFSFKVNNLTYIRFLSALVQLGHRVGFWSKTRLI